MDDLGDCNLFSSQFGSDSSINLIIQFSSKTSVRFFQFFKQSKDYRLTLYRKLDTPRFDFGILRNMLGLEHKPEYFPIMIQLLCCITTKFNKTSMRFKMFRSFKRYNDQKKCSTDKRSKLDLSVNRLGDFLCFYPEKTTFIVTLQHIIQQIAEQEF